MNNEPKLDRNYFLALVLSMGVLLGYSYFLQKNQPASKPTTQNTEHASETTTVAIDKTEAVNKKQALIETSPSFVPAEKPEIISHRNRIYEVDFSTLGGTLQRLVYKGEKNGSGLINVPFYFQDKTNQPGILGLKLLEEPADLTHTVFHQMPQQENRDAFEFQYEKPGEYRLTKRFFLGDDEPVIAMEIQIDNLSSVEQRWSPVLCYALDLMGNSDEHNLSSEAVIRGQKLKDIKYDKLVKKPTELHEKIQWTGLVKKYFAFLVKPEEAIERAEFSAKEETLFAEAALAPFTAKPGTFVRKEIFIFAGPQRYEILSSFHTGFEDVLAKGFFGAFKIILLKSLKFFNQYVHNFGWAILLLTLLIKLLFTPLTHMSLESMRKMQALQPKIKSLQERHKKDPNKMNQEMMELYRKHRVNPMGGCLPMLLQIPIFIAFYQMLNDAIELKGAPFILWMKDLAEPDRFLTLPFSLPFVGDGVNLLPLLMAGSMVWQQKLSPQMGTSPEQAKMMNLMMPIMFGFMFYGMPSGLVLYWLVNNLLSILHQGFIKKMVPLPHHDDE